MIQFDEYFSDGLVQPPTRIAIFVFNLRGYPQGFDGMPLIYEASQIHCEPSSISSGPNLSKYQPLKLIAISQGLRL